MLLYFFRPAYACFHCQPTLLLFCISIFLHLLLFWKSTFLHFLFFWKSTLLHCYVLKIYKFTCLISVFANLHFHFLVFFSRPKHACYFRPKQRMLLLFQTKERMLLFCFRPNNACSFFFQTKHRMFSLPDNTLVLFEKIHFYIIIITILLSFLSFETLHWAIIICFLVTWARIIITPRLVCFAFFWARIIFFFFYPAACLFGFSEPEPFVCLVLLALCSFLDVFVWCL